MRRINTDYSLRLLLVDCFIFRKSVGIRRIRGELSDQENLCVSHFNPFLLTDFSEAVIMRPPQTPRLASARLDTVLQLRRGSAAPPHRGADGNYPLGRKIFDLSP